MEMEMDNSSHRNSNASQRKSGIVVEIKAHTYSSKCRSSASHVFGVAFLGSETQRRLRLFSGTI